MIFSFVIPSEATDQLFSANHKPIPRSRCDLGMTSV